MENSTGNRSLYNQVFCVAQNVRDLAIYGKGATNLKKCVRCEVGDCKKKHYENVLIAGGGGGGSHSAAMKTCLERKKRMREFYLREKNVTYTSNLSAKLMSQQKDQMDQNDLLRKRAQDLTQENLTLNVRVAKKKILERTAIKAEQLSEILTCIFHHIISFHEHGP